MNRLRKEINKLLSKEMSNIEAFSKLRFSRFKICHQVSFWGAPITVWEQKCVWLFYHFNFENGIENGKSHTHSFRETNLVFQLI